MIAVILIGWFLVSVVVGLLVGRFIEAGKGPRSGWYTICSEEHGEAPPRQS